LLIPTYLPHMHAHGFLVSWFLWLPLSHAWWTLFCVIQVGSIPRTRGSYIIMEYIEIGSSRGSQVTIVLGFYSSEIVLCTFPRQNLCSIFWISLLKQRVACDLSVDRCVKECSSFLSPVMNQIVLLSFLIQIMQSCSAPNCISELVPKYRQSWEGSWGKCIKLVPRIKGLGFTWTTPLAGLYFVQACYHLIQLENGFWE
jgi:hypothetical protein